jgi:hypothetical protein
VTKRTDYARRLEPLLRDPLCAEELARLLAKESGLPGPRGNLELAWAFARGVTESPEPAAWLATLYRWADISAGEAPTGDPREFLPFCAVNAFGALYRSHTCGYPCTQPCTCGFWPAQGVYLLEAIRRAAEDPRWRLREAAAMALQRIGEDEPEALPGILDQWLTGTSLLARRAVLAALAHPPLLGDTSIARYGLGKVDEILSDAASVPAAQRRSEEYRVLIKGLSYAPSVIVASLPEEGFALLERWAGRDDWDIRRVIAANLKKRRLAAAAPARAAALSRLIADRSR